MKLVLALFSLVAAGNTCFAADKPALWSAFQEKKSAKSTNAYIEGIRKSRQRTEEEILSKTSLPQTSQEIYRKFNDRVKVPGFISASQMPQLARIIGPKTMGNLLRQGDTIYLRWAGAPFPRKGDRFATFSPAIVTQNLLNPTDFSIMNALKHLQTLPKDNRLAGWFYESSGRIQVMQVKGGLVEALLEQVKGAVGVGDEVMPEPPLVSNITPIRSGIQLSAAIVCGSPWDRLSTTKRSFIYINRGSRDGIRVGRVFESIESVKIDQAVGGAAPMVSNGEAIVIHTTDSYSTAMITKQFDVIRIGSLLRTKQEGAPISPNAPFGGYKEETEKLFHRNQELSDLTPIVPSTENLPGDSDLSLPEPRRMPKEPELSELDALEKKMNAKDLTSQERERLDKLSKQEKVRSENLQELEDEMGTPGAPSLDNSFKNSKQTAKKGAKKAPRLKKNDEEELNQLMMEN